MNEALTSVKRVDYFCDSPHTIFNDVI